MDIKNRRSSLRKSIFAKDDESTALITPRLKRRISFSGRHLVREFHREEETKAWDNSYEISDHLNVDETASKLGVAKCSNHDLFAVDKENIPLPTITALDIKATDSKERSNISETALNASVFSNTRELINTTQNGTLCIENSVDITLFEKEKQFCRKDKGIHESLETFAGENTTKNINSFSLDENEVRALADLRYTILGEKTVDFMKDIEENAGKTITDDLKIQDDMEYEYSGSSAGATIREDVDEVNGRDANEAITIYMNDSLSVTHPENRKSCGKTIQSSVTITASPEKISSDANVTQNSTHIMDFTGDIKLPNIIANAYKETNDFQEKLNKISFLQHSDDEMQIVSSLSAKGIEIESVAKPQKRQTIGFSNAIETSPFIFKEDRKNSSIYLNEYIKESPVKTTLCKEQVNTTEIVHKSSQPTKFVVRKISTHINKNSDKRNDFENKSIHRYHKKKQEQTSSEIKTVTILRDPQSSPVHENSLSFSLSNIKKVSLSPDSFSQLIPTEYKMYNFKQLNDEIDRGKIQLFPKTPTTDRKSRENIHFTKKISELPKERRTLFFADDISMSPDITSRNASKPLDSDDYFDFNATADDTKQKKHVTAKCRFSQADDLMLDNTSFLTKAKLGDETTSRNSTKRDLTQLNDIDIFNETLEDGRCQTGGAIASSKKWNNTTICTSQSMLKDADPAFNHDITSITDSSMQINECYIEKSDEEHVADSNSKHKCRQTLHMNEDIVLSKNDFKEFSFKSENKSHMPLNFETEFDIEYNCANISAHVEGTTFQCNKMDLDGKYISSTNLQSDRTIVSGNHISHTILTDNTMERYLTTPCKVVKDMDSKYINDDMNLDENIGIIVGRHMSTTRGGPISQIKIDNEISCRREDDYKTLSNLQVENNLELSSQRKSIYFENYAIEKDFPVVRDGTPFIVDVFTKPSKDYKNDNSVTLNLNESVETEPFKKRIIRNTLHFRNVNIEDDEHGEHSKHSILNTSKKSIDAEVNNPDCKSLSLHKDILVNVDSHYATIKALHSQCTRHFEDAEYVKNLEQTLCTHRLSKTDPSSQQQSEGIVTDFRKSQKNTMDYFDANMDISMEENKEITHNGSKRDNISECDIYSHDKDFYGSMHTSNLNAKCFISHGVDTAARFNFESRNTRKTIQLPYDMDIDETVQTSNEMLLLPSKKESSNDITVTRNTKGFCRNGTDRHTPESKSTRRTLYFNEEIAETQFCNSLQGENEIKKNFEILHIPRLLKKNILNDEIQQLEHDTTKAENISGSNLSTLGFLNNITEKEMCADNNIHDLKYINLKNEIESNSSMETVLIEKCTPPIQNLQRKTIIFNENDKQAHIRCEDQKETFSKFGTKSNHINADKLEMSTRKQKNALEKCLLKNIFEINNEGITPGNSLNNRKFFELTTPRKSLDEFLAYEKRTEKEWVQCGNLDDNQCQIPDYNENSMKRLPANLTPVSSVPKKRHTLENSKYKANKTVPVVTVEKKCNKSKTNATNHNETGVQTSKILATDEDILHNTPQIRISRIPLPLSSGKIMETSSIHSNLHNVNELVEPSIFDGGEFITDSIQELRKATIFRRRDSLLDQNEQIHSPERRKTIQASLFEENPITISDVSVYFHDQKKGAVNNCDMTNIAPIEEMKCKSFHKRYMNLTCDSPLEDIDQTRISLVRTLSDEDEDESKDHFEEIDCDAGCDQLPETCSQIGTESHFYNIDKRNDDSESKFIAKQLQNVSSMCRKCKRCQITFMSESTTSTTNSFVLPSLPPAPTLDMNRLRRLRTRPHISDVNVLWQRSSLNRTVINPNNIFDQENMSFGDNAYLDCREVTSIIREYKSDIQRFITGIISSKPINSSSVKPSLVSHLNDTFRHSNWVMDIQMQYNCTVVFIHRKMLACCLVVNYEEADELGTALQLKSAKYDNNHVPRNNWDPIDFILDFQFKLNSPFDLTILCGNCSESGISRMISKIDQVCIETILMGVQLQRIVFHHGSSIIRDENRTFVRKIVRKIVSSPGKIKHVEKVEFRIELLNIKKLCFKDITMPALYSFSEDIHLLPVGLTFLNKFLQNPLGYLKQV